MKRTMLIETAKALIAVLYAASDLFKTIYARLLYRFTKQRTDKHLKHLSPHLAIEKIVYIKSSDLSSFVTNSEGETLSGRTLFNKTYIKDGEWDTYTEPIIPNFYHKSISYRTIMQMFQEGRSRYESDDYERFETIYSQKQLERKFDQLQNLFQSMKENGYKSQKDLGVKRRFHPDKVNEVDEMKVVIDRNGRFLKVQESGKHRLAMAHILQVKYIPVYVQGVHCLWAEKCLEKHGGDVLSAINTELSRKDVSVDKQRDIPVIAQDSG
ncbi:hypothetical protein [Salisediminibacterium halotolerans]|uniref:hypothetical protein n=1 Tax=Salisediminibacterium halotolerans TaxID=517425 RepID=UPI000EB48E74|nr:hypothetical protein [Salisediminibacterium halotolerans]RLJ75704.1 hypothetical protein BCL39_1222 [Actinophytocola xinjiangensis]RPE89558.1 hypothetical protein EDD67_0335 [Salisediminibacterium halotolerans]TWG36317.1 hypothetical protein BCL52_1219 [Salisediminibacterium halotolerans]GEL07235.1 hypothetical protein SHA02_06510 [Salisediminibacterium halotolerans]